MVLQRDREVPVFGLADPGAGVEVTLLAPTPITGSASADGQGRWMVRLAAMSAGGPYAMEIRASGRTLRYEDVLIGDVWVCSGQSNMEWPVTGALDGAEEIAAANHPRIRLLQVPRHASTKPRQDFDAHWTLCEPESARAFSAVAYFFGRHLHRELNVPIGLIHASWGGSAAEAWTPRQAMLDDPQLRSLVTTGQGGEEFDEDAQPKPHVDPGNEGVNWGWASNDFDDRDWDQMSTPGAWEATGLNIDGSVWFRRSVTIPDSWAGSDLELSLGAIDDFDITYFNGHPVGQTGTETPNWWAHPRLYRVPGSLVQAGSATLAIRVFDQWGGGGLMGPRSAMSLRGPTGESIPLDGAWKFRVELALPPAAMSSHTPPGSLFNAMIAPLIPTAIRGAIWYQGESNADRAFQYHRLLSTLIGQWRKLWKQGDFPFLIVQLANFRPRSPDPQPSTWANLRQAQQDVSQSVPNTALALAIDVGDADDIHPRDKQTVGERLALQALKVAHGKTIEADGPAFESMSIGDAEVRLRFAYGPLVVRGSALEGFTLAGEDRRFFNASARLEDDRTVVLSSAQVPCPIAARYAWADNPPSTLYNRAELPAAPFRGDDWE